MGHDHAAATVAVQTELVHGITTDRVSCFLSHIGFAVHAPVLHVILLDQLEVAIPKVANDLCALARNESS